MTDVPLEGWIRFGRALQDWREDVLGYKTRAEFVRKTGINIRMVQDLEKSPPSRAGSYTKFALQDAAEAYQIQPAAKLGEVAPSILAVLHGEADTFDRAGATAAIHPAPPAAAPGLPPAPQGSQIFREDAARPYVGPIFERLGYLHAARHIAEPTGEEMVREPDGTRITRIDGTPLMTPEDISVFDGARGAMSDEDRVWLVGDIRARREARAAERDASSA